MHQSTQSDFNRKTNSGLNRRVNTQTRSFLAQSNQIADAIVRKSEEPRWDVGPAGFDKRLEVWDLEYNSLIKKSQLAKETHLPIDD
jgi:hypothetical protein